VELIVSEGNIYEVENESFLITKIERVIGFCHTIDAQKLPNISVQAISFEVYNNLILKIR
jgi:hypothetical protein